MKKSNKKKTVEHFPAVTRNEGIAVLLIMLLTVLIYTNGLDNTFTVADDDTNIVLNDNIKDLSFNGVKHLFTTTYQDDYRPLTYLSYSIVYALFGLDATAFFLANLLLHLLNIFLVFYFVKCINNNWIVAGITALLFAIHPMHVESVAWLSAHNDVLYSSCFLLSLIAYVVYSKEYLKKYLLLSILFFVLAAMAKPLAIALPFVLALIDYYRNGKVTFSDVQGKWMYFVIAMVFGVLTLKLRDPQEAVTGLDESFTVLDRVLFSCYALSFYTLKLIFPFGLSAFYYFPEKINNMLPRTFLLSPILVIAVSYFIYRVKQHKREVLFASLFFLVNLVLILQLVPFGTSIVAERYSYIAYIGLFFLVGYFVNLLLQKELTANDTIRKAGIGVLGALVVFFSFKSWQRNDVWKNSITLTSDVIDKYPDRAMAYHHRGLARNYVKDYKLALGDFDKALAINGKYAEAYTNRGTSKFYLGDYEGALKDYNQALELRPKDITSLNHRGMVKNALEDHLGAIKDFNQVLKFDPGIANAYLDRGNAKFYLGYPDKAIEDFSQAIALNPEYADAYANRGIVFLNMDKRQQACSDLLKASTLGHDMAHQNYLQNCQ